MASRRKRARTVSGIGDLGTPFPWYWVVLGGLAVTSALVSWRINANAQALLALKAASR